ncbi:hypothetical protein LOY86_003396 [Ophidiomyces ophidiicola]|nr:hypothetical protein LOZ50_003224 [Ophidiomyces ophidiicola]KAI2452607.1 hypothetical protein LOY86_003396 [Ophidiomyces ophidiicola]
MPPQPAAAPIMMSPAQLPPNRESESAIAACLRLTPPLAVAHHPGFSQPPFSHPGMPAAGPQLAHNNNNNTAAFAQSMPMPMPMPMASAAMPRPAFTTPARPPPLPGQPAVHTPTAPQFQPSPSPHSPHPPAQAAHAAAAAAREKARVTVLLDINSALLQEVVHLQATGKAGVANQPTTTTTNNPSPDPSAAKPTTKASPAYVDCMRRLQANLAYLATIADRAKKAGAHAPAAPAIMTPPPSMPALQPAYAQLNDLFPAAAAAAAKGPLPPRPAAPQPMPPHAQPFVAMDGIPGSVGAITG